MADKLLAENRRVTNAVMHANTFSLSTRIAVLITGLSLWRLYTDGVLSAYMFSWPVIALAYGTQWLYRNKALVTHDADYPAAITKVKWTMTIWAAVLLGLLGVNLFLNGLPDWQRLLQLLGVIE